jgi:sugar lactone lactonase YvrE
MLKMATTQDFSRRSLLGAAGAAGAAAFVPGLAYADDPVIPGATIAAREGAPIIPKKVNKLFNNSPTIKEPNDMQFAADGKLWLLDQVDPNKVFTVDPQNGKILSQITTECIHGSGITIGDGALWLTSTKALSGPPVTMKVDMKTGATIKKWETPGWGVYGVYASNAAQIQARSKLPLASGGHGVKWTGDGQYWMAVPASGKIYLMNAEDGTVARYIQAPTVRTHGLALDGDYLWCVGSDEGEIFKLQKSDGKIVAKIRLDKQNDPSIHGLDMKDGVLWYCDANKGWICNLT